MTAKAERIADRKVTHSIFVDGWERACVNCIYYEQYFRRNRGNVVAWTPTSTGRCLMHDCERGALRQPCEDFEREGK